MYIKHLCGVARRLKIEFRAATAGSVVAAIARIRERGSDGATLVCAGEGGRPGNS